MPPNRSPAQPTGQPPVAIVVSRYHGAITNALLDGARRLYLDEGGREEDLGVIDAPGSYELTAIALAAAQSGMFKGVVAIGCVVKGETDHDRYINEAVAHGLTAITLGTGIPCAFGLLTVDAPEQAEARAGGEHGNKGTEAMGALLDTLRSIDAIGKAVESGKGPSALPRTIGRIIAKPGTIGGAGSEQA